ncbi:MAG: hypothetical protein ABEJ80_00705 [Halarchaeum sp.]
MNTPSLPVRALVFVGGALLGGIVAGTASAALPAPLPVVVGFSVALPVMNVALHPERVPDDRERALGVGVLSAACGIVGGVAVGLIAAAQGTQWATPAAVLAAFLATEYGGRWVADRVGDDPRS